jgi:hypothetical protein
MLASIGNAQYYRTIDSLFTTYPLTVPHGQWYLNNGAVVIAVTQNVYSWVTNAGHNMFTVSEAANGIVMQGDSIIINRKIAVTVVGNFVITGGATDDFRFRMTVNGTPASIGPMSVSTNGAGYYLTGASCAYAECDSGTVIKIEVTNVANNNDPTIRDAALIITTDYKRK